MALVLSRQHKVYKTKLSHLCELKWLLVSHHTLVQEENYLSQSRHIWQGDALKICAHVVRLARSAERDHAQIGSWGSSALASRGVRQNSHAPPIGSWANTALGIRVAKAFIKKTQKGGVHHFQDTTEADSRPLLRQLSSTHQSAAPCHDDLPWHWPPEALPCWTDDFACPVAHLATEILPCKMLKTPLPTVCLLDLQTEILELGFTIPPLIVVCMCYISLRLLEHKQDINVRKCSTLSERAFRKAE